MKQIDLDDLPPRIASMLRTLATGETVRLVDRGAVIVTLSASLLETLAPLPPEAGQDEVMEQFRSMIEDEF